MEQDMKENIRMEQKTGKEHSNGQINQALKENFLIIIYMA
jgi:hypothetical protein